MMIDWLAAMKLSIMKLQPISNHIVHIFELLIDYYRLLPMPDIWLINPKFWMINGEELILHVYYNNRLLLWMVFMVNKAPFEWKLQPCEQITIEKDRSLI